MNAKIWLSAFRLRTLPLASASIVLGSFLAAAQEQFSWKVALLCFVTAILLQILSNLANDYGDSIHGADSKNRVGPKRATQSGAIKPSAMRRAVLIFTGLCLAAGYILIRNESLAFHAAGLAAIAAAVAYTAGPKPYGYVGLGDIFVFLFFGVIGVFGSYYLHTHSLDFAILLPASACGLFSAGVLNVNNMRDRFSDEAAGKITIPVRLGERRARIYHWLLLAGGILCAAGYAFLRYETATQWLFLISVPLFWMNATGISRKQAAELDPYLRQLAITTLIFTLTFGIGGLL